MLATEKKKRSCSNCRKIKRKCDGGNPCSSCVKKRARCDYNTMDRRSQRFSIGYIKSLETNNDVLERTLAELVSLREEPEELAAKLESLCISFPKKVEKPDRLTDDIDVEEDIELVESTNPEELFVSEHDQYFGAGNVYYYSGGSAQEPEPLLSGKNDSNGNTRPVITLEQDYEYVAGLVRGYFEKQYHGTLHTLFDRRRILQELEARNLSGPFLSEELIYAICANCELLTHDEAGAYCDYVLQNLVLRTLSLSIALSQCYTLLGLHCASKGQISKAWLFVGIGIRVGLDAGFDMPHGPNSGSISNRCFMGTLIIDQYLAMSLGRRPSLLRDLVPVLRLEGESEADFLNVKYSVELIEMTRPMVRSTYQPVNFDKDPKINYLLKFNRLKVFNMKLLKWKQSLDPACSWLFASLNASKDLARENHTLKFLYYYILIFLNKPFLHVPKQHSTVYLIEEMAKEVYLIVHQKLIKIEEETGLKINSSDNDLHVISNKFCTASMDICVVMLLAKVSMMLITSQPEHYTNLEKQFRAFAHYINHINLRKYDDTGKPLLGLLRKFEDLKMQRKNDASISDDKLPRLESFARDDQNSSESNKSSPPTSESLTSDLHNKESDFLSKSASISGPGIPWNDDSNFIPTQAGIPDLANEVPYANWDSYTFDPWWQGMDTSASRLLEGFYPNGGPPINGENTQQPPLMTNPERPMGEPPMLSQVQQPYVAPSSSAYSTKLANPLQGELEPNGAFYNYDQLPKTSDPVDQVLNQLFSNNGDEFAMEKDCLDWNSLFNEKYRNMPRYQFS